MRKYYRKSSLKNRLMLAVLLLAAIFLISIFYKNPETSFLKNLKKGTINALAYVQLGTEKVFSPVYNGWMFLGKLAGANQENIELRKTISNLKGRLYNLAVIEEENRRLRKLMRVLPKGKYKTIMAFAVGASSNNWEASIVIDKGTKHGVKKRMPVMSKDGLVGQVIDAAPLASQVQLITDVKSGVGASILGKKVDGLVRGTYDNGIEMTLVNKTAKLQVGDMVVTSGLGGVYPRGLFIGRIKVAKRPPSALYVDIKIQSEVNFRAIKEVLVIRSPLPPDIDRFK